MKLAKELGWFNVDAMLATSPNASEQLDEWLAYDHLDPFGDDRGDMQAGIVANVLRGTHGLDYLDPRAYVLRFDEPAVREQTPEEMEATMKLWAEAHNAWWASQQASK